MLKVEDIELDDRSILLSVRLLTVSWGYTSILGHSSITYVSMPLQVVIPKRSDIDGFIKVEAKYIIDYETEGATTMDTELYNYTNTESIPDSEVSMPNQTWGNGASGWIDITAYEGKSLRLRTKRVGGTGGNNVKIEGGVLLLKYT